jgi:hypothetical protein
MFTDLVGSTALSTKLDPEDLRSVIGAYHTSVAGTRPLRRFRGQVHGRWDAYLFRLCAFSKLYPLENYVISELSDILKFMTGWFFNGFLRCGHGSASAVIVTKVRNGISCRFMEPSSTLHPLPPYRSSNLTDWRDP